MISVLITLTKTYPCPYRCFAEEWDEHRMQVEKFQAASQARCDEIRAKGDAAAKMIAAMPPEAFMEYTSEMASGTSKLYLTYEEEDF